MKLKQLLIKNFRNYSGETIFDLSKDITILYGENGNGKSSFFDAIEWCVTGEIKRFAPINKNKSIISNSSTKNTEECMVCLYFNDFILKRSFVKIDNDNYNNIKVSISNCLTKEVIQGELNVIKKIEEIVSKDSIYKWDKKAMSQAYILSQSQINSFITKDNPKDRYDSLASIMGFDKVNNLKKNIQKSIFEVKNQISLNSLEIDRINKKIEDLQNKFNKSLKQYELNAKDIGTYLNVEGIAQELSDVKSSYLKISIDKEELLNKNFKYTSNPELLENLKLEKESKIKRTEQKLDEKSIEKTVQVAELDKLNKDYKQIKEEIELVKKEDEKTKKLKKSSKKVLGILESNNILDIEHISFELQKSLNEKTKLTFRLERNPEFVKRKSETSYLVKEIETVKEKQKKLELEIKKLNETHKVLLEDFANGEVSGNIQNLLLLIEHASDVTKENIDYKNSCPVCDSEVDNLEEYLNIKVQNLVGESGKYKEKIEKNISDRDELNNKIISLEKDKEFNSEQIITMEKKKNENGIFLKEISNNVLFDTDLFKLNDTQIDILITDLDNRLKDLKEVQQIQKETEKLKLELLLPTKITLLEKNISPEEIKKWIKEKEELIKNIQLEIENEKQVIKQEKISEAAIVDNIDSLHKLYKRYLIDSDIELISFLDTKLREFTVKEKNLENSLKKSNEINELKNIEKEISRLPTDRKEFEITDEYYKNIEKKLRVKDDIIKNNFGDQTVEFLNNPNSSIIKYYQYLNPNPVEFQELLFEVTNNSELDIKVKNENNSTIANYMLSSGQLNVLAISIFIATNSSQSFSFFNFIAIDDPIQNMDDVNRFSITDVLSSLQRQLIFSTHDIDYLNLFIKKNEYRINDISVYNLDSENNTYKNILISEIAPQKN